MKELIEAITRAANAVAAYYEGAAPTTRATTSETEVEPATRRTRAKKETTEAPAADIGLDEPASVKPAAKKGGMTEEESAKAVTDTAKLLVSKFSKVVDGKPEGFHIAKKLLIEGFKVGRLSDLSHEQRIDFVKQVKEILTKEPVGI